MVAVASSLKVAKMLFSFSLRTLHCTGREGERERRESGRKRTTMNICNATDCPLNHLRMLAFCIRLSLSEDCTVSEAKEAISRSAMELMNSCTTLNITLTEAGGTGGEKAESIKICREKASAMTYCAELITAPSSSVTKMRDRWSLTEL